MKELIPPEGLASVAISVIATAPRPSSEWAQLGASAGRDRHGRGRPRNSVGVPRGALALRGCGTWDWRVTLKVLSYDPCSRPGSAPVLRDQPRYTFDRASFLRPGRPVVFHPRAARCIGRTAAVLAVVRATAPPDARGTHDPTHATSSSSSPQRSGRSRRVHSRRYEPRRPRRVAPCTRSCRVRRSRADRRWSPPRTR